MQRFLLFIILFIVLSIRLLFFYSERHVFEPGETFVKDYTFLKEPKKNDISQYFFTDNVLVTLPLFPKFEYGDKVKLEGEVELSVNGDLLLVKNPKVTKYKNSSSFLALSKFIRQRVSSSVMAVMPAKEAGLLLGIVLGVRDKIPPGYYEELRSVGVLHVVAASGANVSILAGFLLPVFQSFMKRKFAVASTGLIILFYALLAGFDPPIVRASIMAFLSYTALLLGKQQVSVWLLVLSGWFMVLFSPTLIEDISFQLSFAATFGILVIKPLIDRFFMFTIIRDDISTTVSAQITTFPLLLGTFGSFPLISFPVNFLILWTVPLIMGLAGIGSLISLLFPALSYPFFLISYPFLFYFRLIVETFSSINLSINSSYLPLPLMLGYYLLLLAVIIKVKGK